MLHACVAAAAAGGRIRCQRYAPTAAATPRLLACCARAAAAGRAWRARTCSRTTRRLSSWTRPSPAPRRTPAAPRPPASRPRGASWHSWAASTSPTAAGTPGTTRCTRPAAPAGRTTRTTTKTAWTVRRRARARRARQECDCARSLALGAAAATQPCAPDECSLHAGCWLPQAARTASPARASRGTTSTRWLRAPSPWTSPSTSWSAGASRCGGDEALQRMAAQHAPHARGACGCQQPLLLAVQARITAHPLPR